VTNVDYVVNTRGLVCKRDEAIVGAYELLPPRVNVSRWRGVKCRICCVKRGRICKRDLAIKGADESLLHYVML